MTNETISEQKYFLKLSVPTYKEFLKTKIKHEVLWQGGLVIGTYWVVTESPVIMTQTFDEKSRQWQPTGYRIENYLQPSTNNVGQSEGKAV